MVKETKFFRKQAAKADLAATRAGDPEIAAGFRAMAAAYRSQADAIKKSKKLKKKRRSD
jgi:hypothetical protein